MDVPRLPQKVQAALDYLSYVEQRLIVSFDATINKELQKPLTTQEMTCRRAALEVLTNYFKGEMNHEDMPPLQQPEHEIEIPKVPGVEDRPRSRPLKESRNDEN